MLCREKLSESLGPLRQATVPETWALLPFDSICPGLSLKNMGHTFPLLYLPKLPHGPQARVLGPARKRPYHSGSLVFPSFYQILHIPDPRDFVSSCPTLYVLSYFQALVSFVSSAWEAGPFSFTLHWAEHYTSFKCQLHGFFSGRLPHCLNRMSPDLSSQASSVTGCAPHCSSGGSHSLSRFRHQTVSSRMAGMVSALSPVTGN